MKNKINSRIIFYTGLVFGWFFVGLGILGIILPILPGWPFFFLGLFILGADIALRNRIIGIFPKRFRPGIQRQASRFYPKKRGNK